MWLILGDKLHSANLWSSGEGTCGEGVDESLDRILVGIKLTADARDEMDDVGVVLQVFVEIHLHPVTVPRKVVAGKVYEHHELSVLLGIIAQIFSTHTVSLSIARTLGSSCDGVDVSLTTFDAAMCLGRRAKDAEASEVEVEQIG